MKKFIIVFTISIFSSYIYSEGLSSLRAQETFVRFDPGNQYLEIIEYNLLSENSNNRDVESDVNSLTKSIKKGLFAKNKFKFKYFHPLEEKVTNEGSYIKGSYYLYTQEKNIKNLMADVFSNILNREVDIQITEENINVIFTATGYTFSTNNAEGIYGNGEKAIISWRNGTPTFELVFRIDPSEMTPLITKIKNDISSPELNREKVNELKFASPELDKPFQDFQDDADIYRLRHIKYYGELIEKYFKKKGHYPFQGEEDLPVYVFIANDEQEEFTKQDNPYPHKVYSLKEFFKEIEKTLGTKVDQFYDPQFRPFKKPNYYMYMIRGDQYFFAVHTSRYNNFTTKVADNYYKVEISNKKIKGTNIQLFNELMGNKRFNEIINSAPEKEGFFLEREIKYLNYIKGE